MRDTHTENSGRRVGAPRILGALAAGALALALSSGGARADFAYQCIHVETSKGSFSTVYSVEDSGGQTVKQFDADLELNPGQYKKGRIVAFFVKGVQVGKRRLQVDNNGDLEADLKLTTAKKKGKMAWPANFPNVKPGTTVTARIGGAVVMTCTF